MALSCLLLPSLLIVFRDIKGQIVGFPFHMSLDDVHSYKRFSSNLVSKAHLMLSFVEGAVP